MPDEEFLNSFRKRYDTLMHFVMGGYIFWWPLLTRDVFWWNPSWEKVWYVFARMKCAWLNHLACEALLQQKLAQAQNKPEEDMT